MILAATQSWPSHCFADLLLPRRPLFRCSNQDLLHEKVKTEVDSTIRLVAQERGGIGSENADRVQNLQLLLLMLPPPPTSHQTQAQLQRLHQILPLQWTLPWKAPQTQIKIPLVFSPTAQTPHEPPSPSITWLVAVATSSPVLHCSAGAAHCYLVGRRTARGGRLEADPTHGTIASRHSWLRGWWCTRAIATAAPNKPRYSAQFLRTAASPKFFS